MKYKIRQGTLQLFLSVFLISGAAGAVIYYGFSSVLIDSVTITASAQQDPFLPQRINRIEQRLDVIETTVNRLEQATRVPSIAQGRSGTSETEIRLLRSEIETLQIRLAEAECGLVKLDERTLADTVRGSRKKSGTGEIDRCRFNPDAPLQLSARP